MDERTIEFLESLTPSKIVELLDRYIIGQREAKKAIAIAIRNRFRRQRVRDEKLREEIIPKNILMIGPTGVGKTEIARRIAKIIKAPFVKVEATKFTEVGYVGRDVDSMIRDLVEASVRLVQNEKLKQVESRAKELAVERLLDYMLPKSKPKSPLNPFMAFLGNLGGYKDTTYEEDTYQDDHQLQEDLSAKREELKERILRGEMDEEYVEIEIEEKSHAFDLIMTPYGPEQLSPDFQDLLSAILPKRLKRKKLKVKEALEILKTEEARKLIDFDDVKREAIKRAEELGIVFIDEIDKIALRGGSHSGPDVSREGVQRDLLPLIEGTTVLTKYGPVKTDHILFIAAGAFHVAKVTDLIPELQGRLPIRVELKPLNKEDFYKILKETDNSLIKQYKALLETEGVELEFTDDAIWKISEIAEKVNAETENIGARRLYTIMEKVLEDLSFEAPNLMGQKVTITSQYVEEKLREVLEIEDKSSLYII